MVTMFLTMGKETGIKGSKKQLREQSRTGYLLVHNTIHIVYVGVGYNESAS